MCIRTTATHIMENIIDIIIALKGVNFIFYYPFFSLCNNVPKANDPIKIRQYPIKTKFVLCVKPTKANPIIVNKLSKESVYFDNFVIMIILYSVFLLL